MQRVMQNLKYVWQFGYLKEPEFNKFVDPTMPPI